MGSREARRMHYQPIAGASHAYIQSWLVSAQSRPTARRGPLRLSYMITGRYCQNNQDFARTAGKLEDEFNENQLPHAI